MCKEEPDRPALSHIQATTGVSEAEIERLAARMLWVLERVEPTGDDGMLEWDDCTEMQKSMYRWSVRELVVSLLSGPCRHQLRVA